MEEQKLMVYDLDLTEFGFDKEDSLETEFHIVTYLFYDIGRLMIQSKPKYGGDEIYIEGYFNLERFKELIFVLTGFEVKKIV